MTMIPPAPAMLDDPPRPSASTVSRRRGPLQSGLAAAGFLGPSLFLYVVFVILPTIISIAVAFFDWDLFSTPTFIGFANFARLGEDPALWQSVGNTLLYIGLGAPAAVLLGFAIAVGLNFSARGIGLIRVLYYTPIVVSAAVASIMWAWIYQPEAGIINSALRLFGFQGPAWLSSTTWSLPALTVMLIWLALPLVIMLYLAAFQRIPEMLYEAGMLDGANAWQRMWNITWPSVRGTTLFIVLLQILGFAGNPVEIALIMTDGGPLAATKPLGLYIYQEAFQDGNVGYASALSFVQFAMFVVIGALLLLVSRRGSRP